MRDATSQPSGELVILSKLTQAHGVLEVLIREATSAKLELCDTRPGALVQALHAVADQIDGARLAYEQQLAS